MIDLTFDIANEYLDGMKLSRKDIEDLDAIYKNEDLRHQEFLASQDMDRQKSSIPSMQSEFDDEPEVVVIGNAPLIVESYEEYMASQPKVIKKIHATCEKYCRDRRLCYSDEGYYQLVFVVALHDLIERTMSEGDSSYVLARKIVEEHRNLIAGGNFEKYKETIYPKVLVDEFYAAVASMNKGLAWHKDHECGLLDTFAIAYYYGMEIDEQYIQAPRSRIENFIRKPGFYRFFYAYTVIPYIIQEAIIFLVLPLIGDPEAQIEFMEGPRRWIEDNYSRYISFMMFIATAFWMWLLKILLG